MRNRCLGGFVVCALLALPVWSADVLPPAEVAGLSLDKSGNDVALIWGAVSTNLLGGSESLAGYRVYRDTSASFVPDRVGATNLLGSPTAAGFTDVGALQGPDTLLVYLVSAVDADGNEGNTQ